MDWLRRNWPDLLIGVALIAVIAGIIATLISGGSFFPATNRSAETPDQGSTPLSSTTTPGAAGDRAGAADASDDAGAAGADDPAGAAGADDAAGAAGNAGASGADDAQQGQAGELDPNAAGEDLADGAADADAPAAAADGADRATVNDSPPVAVLPPGQAPQSSAAAATPSDSPARSTVTSTAARAQPATDVGASTVPDAPYRVSVGAYGNLENAQRQLEAFESAGYPVFIGTQGALNIVLVGPYDSEAEARSVAARIRTADMGVADPTVYEFTPEEAAQATAVGAGTPAGNAALVDGAEVAQNGAAEGDDDTVITSASSSAPGVRYLQVGAYATRDSSLPQRERLEGLGFVVTERVESELVKLLIGPFDAANLSNAQGRLEAAGIASFPR